MSVPMVLVEIPANPNCDPVDLRVFHDLGAPQPVRRVRLSRDAGRPAWYDVTGWTTDGLPCPAVAQKVDDSGDGVALLVRGGDAGLRLRPADGRAEWRLDAPTQWGEPFLLLTDMSDLDG